MKKVLNYFIGNINIGNGNIKSNFSGNNVPKENMYYTCIACITLDSVLKNEQRKLSTSLFRRV